MVQRALAVFIIFIFFPIFILLFILVKLISGRPLIFKQKRVGKNKKIFTIYKFRTMVVNAEQLKIKYAKLNEASGPVFKIWNDPRYTKFGKLIAHSALDELPQLINIIKGEMTFVGPRPLPTYESDKIPDKYSLRFTVLPGLTSPWVIQGGHALKFTRWMELDIKYVKTKNTWYDIKIVFKTIKMIIVSLLLHHD